MSTSRRIMIQSRSALGALAVTLCLVASAASLLLASDPAGAQSAPPTCYPVNSVLCAPRYPAPFEYASVSCGGPTCPNPPRPPFVSEQDALNWDLTRDYCNACNLSTSRSGWLGAPEPTQGACGASGANSPTSTAGFETGNYSKYSVTYGGLVNGVCTGMHTDPLLMVRRDRLLPCPDGYNVASGGLWCTRVRLIEFKNFGCTGCAAGNPISIGFGNKFERDVDTTTGGPSPLEFVRVYNSRMSAPEATNRAGIYYPASFANAVNTAGIVRIATRLPGDEFYQFVGLDSIGANWRHNYQRSLQFKDNTALGGLAGAYVFRPDGKVTSFIRHNGVYYADADVRDTLTPGAGGWTYVVAADDSTETYGGDGRLLSIRDRAGRTQTLAYDTCLRLTSVTDDFGRHITLTYFAPPPSSDLCWTVDNRVATMADPSGGVTSYGYDVQGRLTDVHRPDGTTRTYVYEDPLYLRGLTGIIDESGTRYASYAYDALGRANMTEHANGAGHVGLVFSSTHQSIPGNVTVTDAANATRTYTFSDVLGVARNTGVTQPAASGTGTVTRTTTYDANGNMTGAGDFNGNRTCYTYDTARNLETKRVEGQTGTSCPGTATARSRTTTTSWHATYRLPLSISVYAGATGTGTALRTTTFTYDAAGNTLTRTITDPATGATRTWTWTYDGYGRVLTADGPRTDVVDTTTHTYYTCTTGFQCGQVATVTNALSQVTTYNTYNAHGQPLTITDPNGVVTTLTYDARQRLTSRQVGTETTTFSYWPTGKLKRVTQPDLSYVEYTYDAAQRLTQIADTQGNKVVYTLDAMGNRTEEKNYDPGNVLTRAHTRVINTLNQITKEIGAANTAAVTTTLGYDNNGNPTTTAAPLARNSSNAYDELNRLKQVTDPSSGLTKYAYDALDNLTQVLDPRNLATNYVYNGLGDLAQLTSPDTGITGYTYDSGGNLKTQTDARTKVGTYGYDALNRVTSLAYTDRTLTFGYDAGTNGKGRLTSASDANHSLAWTYDALGRVLSKGQTVGTVTRTVGYAYTSANLTTLTTPSGQAIGYAYDTAGRVSGITINGTTLLSSILYDPFGPIRSWTWGNATFMNRVYDLDGKLSSWDSAGFYSHAYDDAFRITGVTDSVTPANSFTYGYDLLDRLTSATRAGLTVGWTYDANGNRLTQTGTNTATYTNSTTSNRISTITGSPARTYTYDAAGNTKTYGTITLTYQDDGRLKTAVNGATTGTYAYNALGQRVKKTVGSTVTLFAYDEAGHLLGEYDSAGALIQETVWLGDIPVATLRPKSGGGIDVFYVHADHLNTPRKITRPSDNALRWRWDVDPFGTNQPNQNPASLGTFTYNLRYPGQYYDSETGLHQNSFRDYDPQVGRYVESDPIGFGGGLNTYAYAHSRSSLETDPYGLFALTTVVMWSDVDEVPGSYNKYVAKWVPLIPPPPIGATGTFHPTRCNCVQSCGSWTLSECKSTWLIDVLIRSDLTPDAEEFARAAEREHVLDLRIGADGIRRAGEAAERSLKLQTYATKADCEHRSSEAMISALQAAARGVVSRTKRRDVSSHTYPGWPFR